MIGDFFHESLLVCGASAGARGRSRPPRRSAGRRIEVGTGVALVDDRRLGRGAATRIVASRGGGGRARTALGRRLGRARRRRRAAKGGRGLGLGDGHVWSGARRVVHGIGSGRIVARAATGETGSRGGRRLAGRRRSARARGLARGGGLTRRVGCARPGRLARGLGRTGGTGLARGRGHGGGLSLELVDLPIDGKSDGKETCSVKNSHATISLWRGTESIRIRPDASIREERKACASPDCTEAQALRNQSVSSTFQ
jgi:hypothetical protein